MRHVDDGRGDRGQGGDADPAAGRGGLRGGTNSGFSGAGAETAQQAISSTEGFAFVLAALKALLEHGVSLNLVPDRWPDGLPAAES